MEATFIPDASGEEIPEYTIMSGEELRKMYVGKAKIAQDNAWLQAGTDPNEVLPATKEALEATWNNEAISIYPESGAHRITVLDSTGNKLPLGAIAVFIGEGATGGISSVAAYPLVLSDTETTSVLACAEVAYPNTVYSLELPLAVGTNLYANATLSALFPGNGGYYKIQGGVAGVPTTVKVEACGNISAIDVCSTPCRPTGLTFQWLAYANGGVNFVGSEASAIAAIENFTVGDTISLQGSESVDLLVGTTVYQFESCVVVPTGYYPLWSGAALIYPIIHIVDGVIADIISAPASLSVGDSYAGGTIVYLDGTGLHGIVMSNIDSPIELKWDADTYGTPTPCSAYSEAIGSGPNNTDNIVATIGADGQAAKYCSDLVQGGYSDWYLPSYDLIKLVYNTPALNALVTGFGYYWCSTERDNNGPHPGNITTVGGFAWAQPFPTDFGSYWTVKYATANVKPFRNF